MCKRAREGGREGGREEGRKEGFWSDGFRSLEVIGPGSVMVVKSVCLMCDLASSFG